LFVGNASVNGTVGRQPQVSPVGGKKGHFRESRGKDRAILEGGGTSVSDLLVWKKRGI